MFLDHPESVEIARDHAQRGIELAFAANKARNRLLAAEAADDELDFQPEGMEEDEWLVASRTSRERVVRSGLNYDGLVKAAGAFLAAETIGGEYLAFQQGLPPYRYNDGGYTASHIHQNYKLP